MFFALPLSVALPCTTRAQASHDVDLTKLIATERQIESLLQDIDALVGTRPELLLGRWIADVRRWGKTALPNPERSAEWIADHFRCYAVGNEAAFVRFVVHGFDLFA